MLPSGLENVQLYLHASVGLVPVRSAQVMATLSYLSCPHFPGNRLWRFPGKWGRVEGGSLVAATCIPDRDEPDGRFNNQNMVFTDS